jgi:hypothetical protein
MKVPTEFKPVPSPINLCSEPNVFEFNTEKFHYEARFSRGGDYFLYKLDFQMRLPLLHLVKII